MKLTERHVAGEIPAIPVELAFLRVADNHHDLVLAHDPNKTYRPRTAADEREGSPAIHPFAFACRDRAGFETMLARIKDKGIAIVRGPVLHSPWQAGGEGSWGENLSFYILDPDGRRLEIFCDMATIDPAAPSAPTRASASSRRKAAEI